jgi:hypothetical protein
MYIPTIFRHRRDEDGRKQRRQRHDGEDDGERCLGRSNSLLFLLALFLTGVVLGSGFFFVNILSTSNIFRSVENVRPITTDTTNTNTYTNTNTNTNTNSNSSNNNNKNNSNSSENLSITTTTEDFFLFVKEIYRELLRKYTATTKAVDGIGSVHEYEYDGVNADGNYKKDELLERHLKSSKEGSNSIKSAKSEGTGKGKGKGDGDGDGKSSKKGSKSNKSEKNKGKGKGDRKKGKGKKMSQGKNTRSPTISPVYFPTRPPTINPIQTTLSPFTLSPTGYPSSARTDNPSADTDSVPTATPTSPPTSSLCDDREKCEDCKTFRFNNKQDKDCATWVSADPGKRCKKNDRITGKAVRFFCPVECKKICLPEG